MNISVILEDFTTETKEFIMSTILVHESISVSEVKKIYQKSEDLDIYFIYRGELINDSSLLKDLGIKDGSCIKLAFHKSKPKVVMDNFESSITEIIKKHKEIMKTRSKDLINKIILEEMGNIIESTPELETDLIAYSIASDYRLLRTLFSSRENVTRILEKHPVLIPAALKTIDIIQEKMKQRVPSTKRAQRESDSRYFSLQEVEQSDNSSSDDNEDEEPSTSQSRTETVTRSQLRQAIGSASSSVRSQPVRISLAQLRSAVQTALHDQAEPMEVDEVDSAASLPATDPIEEKLSQLNAMGFVDRSANKLALEASGGDVEAAVEYLIN